MKKQNVAMRLASRIYTAAVLFYLFTVAAFFDIIYVQKALLSKFTFSILKALNKNIVFDFDDALFLYKDITHILKGARSVVVSNEYLRDFASRYARDVRVLPSPVSTEKASSPRQDRNSVVLGWLGSPETTRYLDPLIPVFKNLKERFSGLDIELMGALETGSLDSFGIKLNKWSLEAQERYLDSIDIGIMPLTDDEWSRSKAGYKLLLYMSSGIPCVASPVGINRELIKEGVNGFLADSEKEWTDKISTLIENGRLRRDMGSQGRKLAEDFYSYQTNAPRLIGMLKGV